MAATEDRAARLALNQSMFRDINERLGALLGGRDDTFPREEFLCECASEVCVEHITLTVAEYRNVRADPATFAVFPDHAHVFADVERVVGTNSGYWTVEKQGTAAEVARAEALRRSTDGGGRDRGTPSQD